VGTKKKEKSVLKITKNVVGCRYEKKKKGKYNDDKIKRRSC